MRWIERLIDGFLGIHACGVLMDCFDGLVNVVVLILSHAFER